MIASELSSTLAIQNVDNQINFFKYNMYRVTSLFEDTQWHSMSHRMKSRFLLLAPVLPTLNLTFSPAYRRPLLISTSISIPSPAGPSGFLLPLLLFIISFDIFHSVVYSANIYRAPDNGDTVCQVLRTHG